MQWMETVPPQRDSGELISFRLGLGNWALLSLESPPLIKPIKPRKYEEGMGNVQGNSSLVWLRDDALPIQGSSRFQDRFCLKKKKNDYEE